MKRVLLLLLFFFGTASQSRAFLEVSPVVPTLGRVVNQSTSIVVLQVDKVSREKRVVIYKKVGDLKGKDPRRQPGGCYSVGAGSNGGGNTIREYSATGTDLGNFASTGLNLPAGLAFDAAGNLFVANFGDNTIHEFSATGTDLGKFASAGLSEPEGLAFGPAPAAVPEPAGLTLVGIGAVGLLGYARCGRPRSA
jgi:hypothetical protein